LTLILIFGVGIVAPLGISSAGRRLSTQTSQSRTRKETFNAHDQPQLKVARLLRKQKA
jgi:hypothetical protein